MSMDTDWLVNYVIKNNRFPPEEFMVGQNVSREATTCSGYLLLAADGAEHAPFASVKALAPKLRAGAAYLTTLSEDSHKCDEIAALSNAGDALIHCIMDAMTDGGHPEAARALGSLGGGQATTSGE